MAVKSSECQAQEADEPTGLQLPPRGEASHRAALTTRGTAPVLFFYPLASLCFFFFSPSLVFLPLVLSEIKEILCVCSPPCHHLVKKQAWIISPPLFGLDPLFGLEKLCALFSHVMLPTEAAAKIRRSCTRALVLCALPLFKHSLLARRKLV